MPHFPENLPAGQLDIADWRYQVYMRECEAQLWEEERSLPQLPLNRFWIEF